MALWQHAIFSMCFEWTVSFFLVNMVEMFNNTFTTKIQKWTMKNNPTLRNINRSMTTSPSFIYRLRLKMTVLLVIWMYFNILFVKIFFIFKYSSGANLNFRVFMHIYVHQFKMKRKIKATELLINITGKGYESISRRNVNPYGVFNNWFLHS